MTKKYTLQCSQPTYNDLGEEQNLLPLFHENEEQTKNVWERKRETLTKRWEKVIGKPSFTYDPKDIEILEKFEQPDYFGTLCKQSTGPFNKQLVLIMEPKKPAANPRPGAIVPFYHPDTMSGFDLNNKKVIEDAKAVQFGLHLVRQGYVAVCTEAFPFNTVPEPAENKGFAWWRAASEKLLLDNPQWTGIGKLIWDTSRGVDLLLRLENIDPNRIVIIGHSLGGKMAFCTAAFDERITAVVASDFGIGWDFTNWDDIWYFGKQIHDEDFHLQNHQLLAMIAPRPFLLIAGLYDKPESWQYINEAKKVYRIYQKEDHVGMVDHATGHRPTMDAMGIAYRWLAEQFDFPFKEWKD